jgi:uncharacterized SAM-binding protein YcdF (DUF218 family)
MTEDTYSPEQVAEITDYVDVTALPTEEVALFIFGTNQVVPANLAAQRHKEGSAPLIIATGGVNRHNGVVEGREFARLLSERGVNESALRIEDQSSNTWENVEFALPYLREAVEQGLPIAAICKWYHRRAIHCLRTLLPDMQAIYAITFEPIYSSSPITRDNWVDHPDGKRRIIREWQEVRRRVTDGSFEELNLVNGAWR